MAFIASEFASAAIENNNGTNIAAVQEFDRLFSQAYLGNNCAGDTLRSVVDFAQQNVRPRLHTSFLGQSGFKEAFQEKGLNYSNDQTHHFAAYLSLGINDQKTAAFGHMVLTDLFNKPDVQLGAAALVIGGGLLANPNNLASIGRTIAQEICSGKRQ